MTDRLQFHPIANIFPMMTGAEFARFCEDILSNGLIEPIWTYEGQVIDGRNRHDACIETGVPLRTRPYDGDDPVGFSLSSNLHRRNMNESQRAMTAARVVSHTNDCANLHVIAITQEESARLMSVARRSLNHAEDVLRHGSPELIRAVDTGLMRVSSAATLARQPREKQLARLERERRKADGTHRHKDDWYRTPGQCTRALLQVETFGPQIWEPACGDGAISRELEACGHTVFSSDLYDRGYGHGGQDFLSTTELCAPDIITNPPYDKADEFALHALSLGVRKMALLCRLAWLEGQERYDRLFSQGKLARVWVFSPRQTLWRGDDGCEDDGGMTAYAWFVFERDHSGGYVGDWLTAEMAR